MGKCIKNIALLVIILGIMCVKCFATTDESELLEQYLENAPQQFEFSEDELSDYSNLYEKINFEGILADIFQLLKTQLKNCIGLFVTVSVIVLLFAVLDSFDFNTVKSLRNIAASIISVTVLSICFATIKSNIDVIKESVESMKVFTTAAVPVIGTLCI